MRFNKLAIFVATLVFAFSCGAFGPEPAHKKVMEFSPTDDGCLNDFGEVFDQYLVGTVQLNDWHSIWDCTVDSLNVFKKFVDGSEPNRYSQEDMHRFVSKFLLTAKPVKTSFILHAFELKASILGGDENYLTIEEIDRTLQLIELIKRKSSDLIPLLKNFSNNRSAETVAALGSGLETFANGIAGFFEGGGGIDFSKDSAEAFFLELREQFGWELPIDFFPLALTGKSLLITGSDQMIEKELWPRLFRLSGKLGALALSTTQVSFDLLTGPNAQNEHLLSLLPKVNELLGQAAEWHGGGIPVELFYRIIDELPSNWISIDREILKETLPRAFDKLLHTEVPDRLDDKGLSTVEELMTQWIRSDTHLEKIFSEHSLDPNGVTSSEFVNAAELYLEPLEEEEQLRVLRLVDLATFYRPLFVGNDNQITYAPWVRNSLNNLKLIHLFNLILGHVMPSYSTAPDGVSGTEEDLRQIIEDYGELAGEFKVLDPADTEAYKERFLEGNLFTYASNGDHLFDLQEATYYVASLFSIGNLLGRAIDATSPGCLIDHYDNLGFQSMDPQCFRNAFLPRLPSLLDHFPGLLANYGRLKKESRPKFLRVLETAARKNGHSEGPMLKGDVESIVGLIHFIETTFVRFDLNGDEILRFDELKKAYRVFKGLLAEIAGEDTPIVLKAVFTWVINFKKPPKRTTSGMIAIAGWIAVGKAGGWNSITADRIDLFRVVAVLNAENKKQKASNHAAFAACYHPKVYEKYELSAFNDADVEFDELTNW